VPLEELLNDLEGLALDDDEEEEEGGEQQGDAGHDMMDH
jgi:hypothetical protein